MSKRIQIKSRTPVHQSWAKYGFLLTGLFLLSFTANAAVLNITDDILTYASLTDTTVTMSGVSELHLTSSVTPIPGCVINLNSLDSFFFLENIKPSAAASTYLSQVQVSGVAAVLGTNVRVVEYAAGAVIIPQSSTFQPLQVFAGESFTGSSAYLSQYTTYNTSLLGTMASSISSFILKRGYTATFAQNENGTGYSKNYVAQDCDLEIGVLPDKLNDQINFVRIFPWRWVSKKGIAGNNGSNLNITWSYDWNIDQNSTLDKEYVPIRQTRWWPGLGQDWQARGASHLLGYNEPDSVSQANIAVGDALWSWPDLLATGLRVGSPAPTDGGRSSWLYPFMQGADAADLRVDFVAVHYYWCYDPANPSGAATQMYNFLNEVHNNTGRPIWITEWNNGANWTGCLDPTFTQQAAAVNAMVDMLDSTPWVERYALYNWVEDCRRVEWDDASLTEAGIVYRDQVSPIGYRQEVPGSGKSSNATYSFDENFRDSSGNGNNPLAYGAPKRAAGQYGNALVLDGVNDYLVLPTNMGQGSDFTFAAWIYWNGGNPWQRVFDFGSGTTQYMFLTPRSGSNTLRFAIKNGGSEQIVETTQLAAGQWVHVAVTLNGNTGILYVNGVPAATNASLTINPSNFNPVINYIGDSQFSADPLFTGMIDELYLADHALSGTQITGLMNNNLPLPPTNLTVTDASGTVDLSWAQSASAGITANKIYRSSNGSAGPYTLLDTISPAASYTDATALYDSTYLYAVTAVNSSGMESVYSVCASVVYLQPILSEGKPVTASSFQTGNNPENANDGDILSTRWTAADSTYPQWWRADLGSVQPIGKAVIYWYNSTARAYQYRIEISDDDVNYAVLVDATGNTIQGTTTDTFSATARYVRITVTGVNPVGGWAAFLECQIFGREIPIPNFGFETPTTTSYIYNPSGGSWTFSGSSPNGSGLTTNNSAFTSGNAVAPEGTQVALLQGISSITQSLSDFVPAATYAISFEASQRQNKSGGQSGQTFNIKVDGVVIDSFEPSQSLSSYQRYATAFTASNTNHTLAFASTNLNGGDNTVFIDDVRIIQVSSGGQDTTPPAAPTGLTATAGSGSVSLDWADNTEPDLASYKVYRSTTSGSYGAALATGIAASAYTDNTAVNGTTYYYVVTAVDVSSNESGYSNEASATPADTTPPTPNPAAFATAPYATGSSSIAMAAATGSDPSGPVEYLFTETSGNPGGTSSSWQTSTSYTDTGLNPGTQYTYTVTMRDALANTGTASAPASATTQAAAAPTFVAAGSIASGTGTIAPALPAGRATGDILLLFVETANQAVSISNQNGGTWTAVTNSPQGTGTAAATTATRLTVFWSRYNGTQGAPTVSDSGDHQIGRMIAIRGAAASGNPWDVTAGGVEATSDTSGSIPGATTTVANTLVVTAVAGSLPDATGTANFSAWTNASLTSVTERTDNTATAGNGGSIGIATGIKATAGAYGNTAVTHASAAVKGMMSIAIKN
jgi:fibronectin type 3 domain-containing protein